MEHLSSSEEDSWTSSGSDSDESMDWDYSTPVHTDDEESDEEYEEYSHEELTAYKTMREQYLFVQLEKELRNALVHPRTWTMVKDHVNSIAAGGLPHVYDDLSLAINLIVLQMSEQSTTPSLIRMALRWLVGVELNPGPSCPICGEEQCKCTEEQKKQRRQAALEALMAARDAEAETTPVEEILLEADEEINRIKSICIQCGNTNCQCAENRLAALIKVGYKEVANGGLCVLCGTKDCKCKNKKMVGCCPECGIMIRPGSCRCKGKQKEKECDRCGKVPCTCERQDMNKVLDNFRKSVVSLAGGHCSRSEIENIIAAAEDASDMEELLELRQDAIANLKDLLKKRKRQVREACKICSKVGHVSYTCPQRKCRRCRKTDHTTSECRAHIKDKENRNNHKKNSLVRVAIKNDEAKDKSVEDVLREQEKFKDLDAALDELENETGKHYFGAEDAEYLEQMRLKYHKSYADKADDKAAFVASVPVGQTSQGADEEIPPPPPEDPDEEMRRIEAARFAERVTNFEVKWTSEVATLPRKFGIIAGVLGGMYHMYNKIKVPASSALWQMSWQVPAIAYNQLAKSFKDAYSTGKYGAQDCMDAAIMAYNVGGLAGGEPDLPFVKIRTMPWHVSMRDAAMGAMIGVGIIVAAPTIMNTFLAVTEKVLDMVGVTHTLPDWLRNIVLHRVPYWTSRNILRHKLKFSRYQADPIYPLPDRRHRQQSMADIKCWNPATAVLEYTIKHDGEIKHREEFPADMAIVAQVSAFGNTHAFLSAETCSLKVTNVMSRLQTENYDYTTSLSQEDAYSNCVFVAFAIREAKRQRMEAAGMMNHFRRLGVYGQ